MRQWTGVGMLTATSVCDHLLLVKVLRFVSDSIVLEVNQSCLDGHRCYK
jgi:hypothetical protein